MQDRTSVVPPIGKKSEGGDDNANPQSNPSQPNTPANQNLPQNLQGLQYISIEDFNISTEPVPKLWKSKNKIINVKPITKRDRDKALAPVNTQKIEAQPDGTTKGFFISLELFDSIKEAITEASLSHYTGKDGKPIITRDKLGKMDTSSYDELANICLSVNKIDFFEPQASDVAASAQAKN